MNVRRRLGAFLLMFLLCVGMLSVSAFAASTSQDGLKVTLSTDKEKYSQNEKIVTTLTVENTNDTAVSDVTLENLVPNGYKLADKSEATKQVQTLKAGETIALTVTYAPEKEQTNQGNQNSNQSTPTNTNSNNGAGKSGKGTPQNNTSKNGNNPGTGDNSNLTLWAVLLVLAGVGIVVTVVLRKKSGKKILSLFLCITLGGTAALAISLPANAVNEQSKSLSISESIFVNEATVKLNATVCYNKYEESTDIGEISFRKPTNAHIAIDKVSGNHYVDNEILVIGKEGTSKAEIEDIINKISGNIIGCIAITNDYQIALPSSMSIDELGKVVDQLKANNSIDDAMIHYLYKTEFSSVPNDAKWKSEEWSAEYPEGKNWGVEAINAMGAWEHLNQMRYVNVGIIDTMFDTNHEDLVYTHVWNNPTSLSSDEDLGTHGTHVSGILAACYNNNKGITGVAPKVTLYGYSISQANNDIPFIGWMEWKYALANLITSNCKVINVSMGDIVDSQEGIQQFRNIFGVFLNKLIIKGYDFVLVHAAGNDSMDARLHVPFSCITEPAVKDRIIVVGNIGSNGSHKNGLFGLLGERVFDGYYYAPDSNFGERVDIVAPGENIYSTFPNNHYKKKSGTSMAAPHVSGVATMCFSVNPNLTGAQVKSIITKSATTTVTDANTNHPHRSYPILNANSAVEAALTTHGEAISPNNPSTGVVMGNVRGQNGESDPINLDNVSVSAYRISDSDGNLSKYASSTVSDLEGNYELVLDAGRYYINIYKDGYLPFVICDVTATNDQTTYLDNVILIPGSEANVSNYIQGTVRNALTGSSVQGVTVRLRPGWDNKTKELAKISETNTDAETKTDENGHYSLNVLEGCYTAEFIKEGFVTGYANVICTNIDNARQDAVITPVLSDDEYRIVLTWSSTPADLDSHLSGPLSNGNRFHVYYNNMRITDNSETVAKLDIDDTSSYGPETITFKKTQSGTYKYAVQDFTNRSNTSSTKLSASGAKVELYKGNALIATYHVPLNTIGTVWNVFEIDGDTVRIINTLKNDSSPSAVFSSVSTNTMPIEKAKINKDDIEDTKNSSESVKEEFIIQGKTTPQDDNISNDEAAKSKANAASTDVQSSAEDFDNDQEEITEDTSTP